VNADRTAPCGSWAVPTRSRPLAADAGVAVWDERELPVVRQLGRDGRVPIEERLLSAGLARLALPSRSPERWA